MKKILSLVLCTVMILSIFTIIPFSASAKEAYVASVSASSGTTGDCTWTLDDDGVLTISGDGDMGNYEQPWGTGITKVIIEDGVTSIGDYAFDGCTGLTEIEIPDSVKSIGFYAFEGCTGLTSITIPDSVTHIDDGAFLDCTGLTSVTIPYYVTVIGGYAFGYLFNQDTFEYEKIENFIIYCVLKSEAETYAKYNGIKFICSGTTGYCTWTLDDEGVLTISGEGDMGNYEQSWGFYMSQVIIEDGVTSIGDSAFWDCTGLTSIEIPDSVTSIGDYAFDGCTGLTSITIPDSVESIGDSAFWGCKGLTSVTIGNSVMSIGNYAFLHCTGLTEIEIPDSVTSIGDYTFSDCTGLTSITIPDSVESIGNYAFSDCTSLTSVTIPDSVTSIGDYAFSFCEGLTSIKVDPNNTVYDSRSDCNAILETRSNILVRGCMNTVIPNSVTSIGDYAFYKCTGLTSIEIPDSVTSIGDYAFDGCTGLTSITIPDSVESIGNYAFYDCTSLTSVTIPDSVTSIGDYAFSFCEGLTSIKVDPDNTVYDSRSDCNAILETRSNILVRGCMNTVIPNSVTSIGDYAFSSCTGITSITIPDSVTSIGDYAFYKCTGLTSIEIPDSVTSIGNYAFSFCKGLMNINIPDSVESIGSNTFSGCEGLTSITIPDSVTSIGAGVFSGCTGLTEIEIPDSVTSIGQYAFDGCTSLTSITIPDSVESIGSNTFSGCTGLTNVTIPSSVTSIGEHAFGYVYNSYTNEYKKIENFIIYGVLESEAETYANNNGINFVGVQLLGTTGDCTWTLYDDGVLTISGEGKMRDYTVFNHAPWGSNISKVIINEGVTSIGSIAFYDCKNLTSLTIPDSVTGISKWAFISCTGLTSITIPDSVTSIGEAALGYTISMSSLSIKKIDNFTIYGYKGSVAETYADTNGFTFVELIGLGERLEGYSISLEGDIAVNFYMSMPDEIANNKDVKMHFEIPGGDTVNIIDVPVSEAEKKTVNNKTYYIFKCPVAAKEMTSQIKGYLTLGDSKGKEYTYTIKEYADYILSNTDVQQYAEAAPLVKAMLNYGAYSQLWFDKNTTALANSALDDSEKALPENISINAAEPKVEGLHPGIGFAGSSLSLKSDTSLSLFFTGNENFIFNCDKYTMNVDCVGPYTVGRVRGIKADELSDVCTVTIQSDDITGTVSYVPTYYLKCVLEDDSSSENLKNVAKALYIFHVKAKEYFNSQA